jgi:hypothetical protein
VRTRKKDNDIRNNNQNKNTMNKKISAILIALVFTANAQAQFKFGVRGGFNMTGMTEKLDLGSFTLSPDIKHRPAFQVGVVGEFAVSKAFVIQPAILFATHAVWAEFSETILIPVSSSTGFNEIEVEIDIKQGINLNYIQVPINAQYKFALSDNLRLLVQAGPYLGVALNGKRKIEATIFEETKKRDIDIEFGSAETEMNRLDFGLGFGSGLQFGNFQVGVGYNLGLANLSNVEKTTTRNNSFVLTVTYLFGR